MVKILQGPYVPVPMTTVQRDAIKILVPGMTIFNTTKGAEESWERGGWTEKLTLRQLPPLFTAEVDGTYVGFLSGVYRVFRKALDDNHKRVFITDMTADVDVTVLATDDATRVLGADPETVIIPVNLTVDKDDFSIEQVGFAAKKLKLNGSRQQAGGLLIKDTGEIEITATGSLKTVYQTRFVNVTSTDAITLSGSAVAVVTGVLLERLFFLSGSGTHSIWGKGQVTQLEVSGGVFFASVNSHISHDLVSTGYTRCKFSGSQVLTAASSGGFDIFGSENTIEDETFIGSNGGASRQLRLNSPNGMDIQTRVQRNNFIASDGGGAHILFECASADGDGAGLEFFDNVAPNGGTFWGHQDMQWQGGDLRNTTIDLRGKSGQQMVGVNLIGATLDNIPADLVIRNCPGQDDRGDYIPVHNTVDLGSITKAFKDAYLSGKLTCDTLDEFTSGMGVTIDGVLLKDGLIPASAVPDTHGVTPSAHHIQAHTPESHTGQGATAAELETLTDASDANALHEHLGLRSVPLWMPAIMHTDASMVRINSYPFMKITDNQKMEFSWDVPEVWVSFTKLYLVIYPDTSEDIIIDFDCASTDEGEALTANVKAEANRTLTVVINQLIRWDLLTAGAGGASVLPTVAAGDLLGIRIDSDTPDIRVAGIGGIYLRTK